MNFFSIRTNDQNTIGKILQKDKNIVFDTLSWHKNEISINDIIFIVISGDNSKKDYEYDNGLRAIGKVLRLPKDEKDGKHFSLNIEIIDFLSKSLTKGDFYNYPSLKDAPNIGPEIKNPPNQSFRKIDTEVGKSIFRALADLLNKDFDKSKYSSIVDNNYNIDKLEIKTNSINNIDKIKNTNIHENFIQEKFINWFEQPENNKVSYNGLVTIPVLNFWNSTFFNSSLFALDLNNLDESILQIENLILDKNNSEWRKYSQATSNGSPEAILGKSNYLKFISEFVKDDNNLKPLKNSYSKETKIPQIIFSYLEYRNDVEKVNLKIADNMIIRFISSLLTKPFVILTGLSGSGKTKLAQAFAMWICESAEQYCIVPVGADWTNREPLLGFPNALQPEEYKKPDHKVLDLIMNAIADPNKPYFLILDEMNLSHVERYFADFLSVMETNKNISLHSCEDNKNNVPKEIQIPKNLFIVGTVNIDETTYMFSPKVLDRANVIEFRVTADEIENFLDNPIKVNLKELESSGTGMAESFINFAKDDTLRVKDPEDFKAIKEELKRFFVELKKTGAEFGYRSASEIMRFAAVLNNIDSTWNITQIIDAAIMQKLLPKLHGSRSKLKKVLITLGSFCLNGVSDVTKEIFESTEEIDFEKDKRVKYPVSLEKIVRMYKGAIENGYTSYSAD